MLDMRDLGAEGRRRARRVVEQARAGVASGAWWGAGRPRRYDHALSGHNRCAMQWLAFCAAPLRSDEGDVVFSALVAVCSHEARRLYPATAQGVPQGNAACPCGCGMRGVVPGAELIAVNDRLGQTAVLHVFAAVLDRLDDLEEAEPAERWAREADLAVAGD